MVVYDFLFSYFLFLVFRVVGIHIGSIKRNKESKNMMIKVNKVKFPAGMVDDCNFD